MIRFACPSCAKVYTVPPVAGGKAATCKQCGVRSRIPPAPSAGFEMVEEPPPPPPPPVHVATPPPPPEPTVEAVDEFDTETRLELPAMIDPPPPPPFAFSPPPPPPDPPQSRGPTVVTPIDAPAVLEPSADNVDIAPCPKCRAELTVSVADLGSDVECPFCQTVYTAARPQVRAGTLLAKSVGRRVATPVPPPPADDPPKKPYEFKAKSKKNSPFLDDDDDDGDDRPRRKSRRGRDRDDDDDDDDRRRRKRRPSRGLRDSRYRSYSNHDGVLLLVASIVCFVMNGFDFVFGLLCCNIPFYLAVPVNIYVVIKASLSVRDIRNGTMDPSGRALLEVARALSVVQLLWFLVMMVIWLVGLILYANTVVVPDREPGVNEFEFNDPNNGD